MSKEFQTDVSQTKTLKHIVKGLNEKWRKFKINHPNLTQFLLFFIFSNGITLLQLLLMPSFKAIFQQTKLVNIGFQVFPSGSNFDGSTYYIFNYEAGVIQSDGTGGGLAYFLAIQVTLGIAQIVNFFAQRNVTFKHKGNPWYAALWYFFAYVIITLLAGAAQGFYKAPIYAFLMNKMGQSGETIADILTMLINATIAFWVFFPIFKVIFKNKKSETVI